MSSRELELGTTQSLDNHGLVLVLGTHRHDGLTDVDTRNSALRLAERTTHTGLQTIGACARQHLVDANDVERMHPHSYMKTVLANRLDEVLVGADTRRLERLG